MVSIPTHATSHEDVEKASVIGENQPDVHISDDRDGHACILSGDEIDSKNQTQQIAGATYAIPMTFDVEHDYVVSAVRVESKFSDDDESLGKENKCSTEQNKVSNMTLTQKPSTFPSTSEEKINGETEKDKGSPRNKSQIGGDTEWTDSSDEVDCQKTEFGPDVGPADQIEEFGVENNGSSDVKDDAGSHKWTHSFLSQGPLLGQCSPGLSQYDKTAVEATTNSWDSSCESNGQNVHLSIPNNEEESAVVTNPSASVPPVPDKEDEPKKTIRDHLDVNSCGVLLKKEIMDLGNDQIDCGNLDDDNNSCGSTVKGDVLKSSYVSGDTESGEVAAVEVDGGSSGHDEQQTTNDNTAFENCDSRRKRADHFLPQTDIDDVELDSSDESVVERRNEVRNPEGPVTQVKQENVSTFSCS